MNCGQLACVQEQQADPEQMLQQLSLEILLEELELGLPLELEPELKLELKHLVPLPDLTLRRLAEVITLLRRRQVFFF